MAKAKSESAGLDLTQFYQVFFEEAGENLDNMERLLLEVDIQAAEDEELNAIFRCAHSVKGGAATFGFTDVAELTHQMETLLDKLRRHELQPTAPMVDVLLASGDALRTQLARHAGNGTDEVDTTDLLANIRAMAAGEKPPKQLKVAAQAPIVTLAQEAPPAPTPGGERQLELQVGPLQNPAQADNLVELFSEIVGLGSIEPIDGGQAADGMRRFKVITTSTDKELLDLFSFHVAAEQVKLLPLGPGFGLYAAAPSAPKPAANAGSGVGAAVTAKPAAKAAASPESSTLRVSVDKVDKLINLVGELVITQAMLEQNTQALDSVVLQQLAAGLADLERNTRDLQESVMSIRMIPMSTVFSRFPRLARDLAGKLGKKVDFVTQGEATELDKGMVEKITDPLTHLVRNSCDHGIEMPADRLAKGKNETSTITLAASHQGGSIVIEVRDDGKGLSRDKLLKKAREKGIDAPDSMTDPEVWSLIFAPGFSTADVVTDVSGRGVGMDVVKKNITALGGTVEIDSSEGHGMSVKVRLPLTLAIMDGMSIGVDSEVYILPLSQVVESFTVKPGMVKSVAGSGRVVEVRNEYMPVLELEQVFGVKRAGANASNTIMVVVESDGERVALLVDELLGQQQVVVKNLESNYCKVPNLSGATIMGDGRVALIVDVGGLVRKAL
ncbi:MAG: chemotaxis protein CheW [Burkholderiaceae bacterium]|nr:chemotaxis protein CheW [Burkholderiaceae bacterium]